VDRGAPLVLGSEPAVRFKRRQDVAVARLLPAVQVARRISELLLSCAEIPDPAPTWGTAVEVREQILQSDPYVTLTPLVQKCWDLGIPVVHLKSLPAGARRLDGLALTVAGRPCIVLASTKRSPAWLVWHLAHELGHVAQGHLKNGDAIDPEIDFATDHKDERAANQYAMTLIYGDTPGFRSANPLKAADLAAQANEIGPAHRIHPACVVTSYGFTMKAWDVAGAALKILHVASGGAEPIRAALRKRLDLDCLPATDRHFLAGVTGLAE
jgi:IrrE N-terminal-like domain